MTGDCRWGAGSIGLVGVGMGITVIRSGRQATVSGSSRTVLATRAHAPSTSRPKWEEADLGS